MRRVSVELHESSEQGFSAPSVSAQHAHSFSHTERVKPVQRDIEGQKVLRQIHTEVQYAVHKSLYKDKINEK